MEEASLDIFNKIMEYGDSAPCVAEWTLLLPIKTLISLSLVSRNMERLCERWAAVRDIWRYGYGVTRSVQLTLSHPDLDDATPSIYNWLYNPASLSPRRLSRCLLTAFTCYCGKTAWNILSIGHGCYVPKRGAFDVTEKCIRC